MNLSVRGVIVRLLVGTLLFSGASRGRAQSIDPVAGATAVMVGTAVVAVGIGVGVGAYFIARAPRTTGCVVRDGGGLVLEGAKPGDPGYVLEGKLDALHEGERVKVIGRRHPGTGPRQTIRVKSVAKHYGACSAVASVAAP